MENIDWQKVINAIPFFCWGVLIICGLCVWFIKFLAPLRKLQLEQNHELLMKIITHQHETEWFNNRKQNETSSNWEERLKKLEEDFKKQQTKIERERDLYKKFAETLANKN